MTAPPQTAGPPSRNGLRDKRIGLVLAGGGGKGAYQAGCLQGLYDLNIHRFHVICGTSVGALNGAAAAAGKIPELQKLWREITTASVLRLSWRMPIYLLGEITAWCLLLQRTFLGAAIDLALAAGLAFAYTRGQDGRGFWTILALGLLLIVVMAQSKLLWLVGSVGILLRRWVEASSSVATRSALSQTIEDFLFPDGRDLAPLHCPTFATVARDGFWFDPDFPTFLPRVGLGRGDTDFHFDVEKPLPAHGWLPEYVDVTNFAKVEIIETLLQSACLPHAFRRMRLGDPHALDGGIVNNTPLKKCLEFKCDVILVLHLSADLDEPRRVLAQVPKLRRALQCEAADQTMLHRLYLEWLRTSTFMPVEEDPLSGEPTSERRYFHDWDLPATRAPALVPLEPLGALPPMIHVLPRRPLGGMLTGTLNFRKTKAQSLLIRGRNDLIEAVRATGWLDLEQSNAAP